MLSLVLTAALQVAPSEGFLIILGGGQTPDAAEAVRTEWARCSVASVTQRVQLKGTKLFTTWTRGASKRTGACDD
ncbi:MAG: hypothetical protein AB1938_13400 [Myxococcota bacterium]